MGLLLQHTWTGWAGDKIGTQWSLFLALGPGCALAAIPSLQPSMYRDDAPKQGGSTVTRFQVLVLCSCGFGCHGHVGAFPVTPGWGSWCEPSELGSLSCPGQGFCGGWRGTLTAHIPCLAPAGSAAIGTAGKETWTSVGCSQTLCSVPAVAQLWWEPSRAQLS